MEHKFILTRMGQDTVGADSAIEMIENFPYQKIRDWGNSGWMLSFEKDDGDRELITISDNISFNYHSENISMLAEAHLIIAAFKSIDYHNACIDMPLLKRFYDNIIELIHAYADATSKNMSLVSKYSISITSEFMRDAEHDMKSVQSYNEILKYYKDKIFILSRINYDQDKKEERNNDGNN